MRIGDIINSLLLDGGNNNEHVFLTVGESVFLRWIAVKKSSVNEFISLLLTCYDDVYLVGRSYKTIA